MISAALLVTAAVQLACVVVLWTRVPRSARVWLLGLVGLGVAYDSAVVGIGAVLGEGALLHTLSVPRFVVHALLTPLLILWAADRVDAGPPVRRAAVALTVVALAWGVAFELPHLRLEARHYADTVRYAAEHPVPPMPAVVVSVVLLAAGIVLWRREARRAALIGTVLLFGASAAAVSVPPLGNMGEAAMLAGLVAAELPMRSNRRTAAVGENTVPAEPER
ncbi:hypothetical protein IU449_21750 [Nocardia higoensis]|uniref:Membrane-associated phospholipid phosphatase n=1 Tax=Nocardia higoensis TaxID=228599 RepID=A0ABS0DJG8_9NOCA|nr:hypothetical protein [Nocardia higoensis]MBF6357134.1 hypothetical protein [Nocardia higoensis]